MQQWAAGLLQITHPNDNARACAKAQTRGVWAALQRQEPRLQRRAARLVCAPMAESRRILPTYYVRPYAYPGATTGGWYTRHRLFPARCMVVYVVSSGWLLSASWQPCWSAHRFRIVSECDAMLCLKPARQLLSTDAGKRLIQVTSFVTIGGSIAEESRGLSCRNHCLRLSPPRFRF